MNFNKPSLTSRVTILIFTFFLTTTLSAHQLPARMFGNWYAASGEWRYGLYDSYAVAKGDFWQYKNVAARKTGGFIVTLSKGADTMLIEVSEKSGHSAVVKTGIKSETLYEAPPTKKDFASHTDMAYPKPVFNKGVFVLKGVVGGFKSGSPKAAIISGNFIRNKFQRLVRIDSMGKFELSIPLLAPQYVFIEYGESWHRIWAEPNRELMCFIRPEGKQELAYPFAFSGDLGLLNEELQDYQANRNLKYSQDSFRTQLSLQKNVAGYCKAVSTYFMRLDSLRAAVLNSHHYCDKSRQLINMDGVYERFDFRYPKFPLNRADSNYIRKWQGNFLLPLQEKEEDGILSDNYLFFINQQVRDSSKFSQKFQQLSSSLQHIDLTLNDIISIMKQLDKEGGLTKMESYLVDSIQEIQSNNKLDSTIVGTLNSLIKPHEEYINNQLGDRTDSVNCDVLTQAMQAVIKESKHSDFSKDIFLINQINTYRWVRAKLYQRLSPMMVSEKLKEVAEASVREPEFQFEDAQSMQVFQQVFSPYKGKVLYVDFWGTYCSPCWGETAYLEKLRSHLKDKDVVFLFIAIDDNKSKWLADKEKFAPGAEHLFVEGDTATILKAMFEVSGVPHSVIIGKDGNVVSANAPRPNQQQDIDKLINANY
ncbi:TlpA family protein disulfide reductase [Pinibacter soli]|uniref:TlpA disulfide reductase family protein n=1 Tax=Pinibacter soli TaxID=3044211 RepID=A0ABT6RFE9_9BACT|nr:TlpA disulfide reductase family protein [Pinibacter soli]MDI3321293.1 TlpA disulfide reductase family protein [Pinibacter soli]